MKNNLEVRDEVDISVYKRVFYKLSDEVMDQLKDNDQVWDDVRNKVYYQVNNDVRNKVYEQVNFKH